MISDNNKYGLFLEFAETYAPVAFKGIDREDPLVVRIEELTKYYNQFFIIVDLIQLRILFTSKRSVEMIGIEPDDVSPYHFFEATHPEDIHRHNLGRSKLFGLAQGLFIAESGNALLSSNLKIRNPVGGYSNLLFQCYIFFSSVPVKTVYLIQVHTDIEKFRKIKHGYHYYIGNDLSFFRYPDDKLLSKGHEFSDREFEILMLIKSGLNSEQTAEKLFLSTHTVNTHRSNILEKSGKSNIWEVIYELIEQGYMQ
jgi:hypothetical protein